VKTRTWDFGRGKIDRWAVRYEWRWKIRGRQSQSLMTEQTAKISIVIRWLRMRCDECDGCDGNVDCDVMNVIAATWWMWWLRSDDVVPFVTSQPSHSSQSSHSPPQRYIAAITFHRIAVITLITSQFYALNVMATVWWRRCDGCDVTNVIRWISGCVLAAMWWLLTHSIFHDFGCGSSSPPAWKKIYVWVWPLRGLHDAAIPSQPLIHRIVSVRTEEWTISNREAKLNVRTMLWWCGGSDVLNAMGAMLNVHVMWWLRCTVMNVMTAMYRNERDDCDVP
jgi:hypothetical protein